MTAELPPDVAIETVWVVEGRYSADAAERRRPFRGEHATRLARLRDEGVVLEAGAFADMSASLIVFRVASEQEALALAREDVYLREGVWIDVSCRPFGRLIRPEESAGR